MWLYCWWFFWLQNQVGVTTLSRLVRIQNEKGLSVALACLLHSRQTLVCYDLLCFIIVFKGWQLHCESLNDLDCVEVMKSIYSYQNLLCVVIYFTVLQYNTVSAKKVKAKTFCLFIGKYLYVSFSVFVFAVSFLSCTVCCMLIISRPNNCHTSFHNSWYMSSWREMQLSRCLKYVAALARNIQKAEILKLS